jgi:cell division protein FtsQ
MIGLNRNRNRRRQDGQTWSWPKIELWRVLPGLVGIVGVTLVGLAIVFALDQPIEHLKLQGRFERVTPIEVEQVVKRSIAESGFVSVDLRALKADIERLPWVDKASVARVWPRGLAVEVKEQVAVARWRERGLLNARGELFLEEARFIPPELPRLSGPDGAASRVGQRYLASQGRLIEGGVRLVAMRLDERGSWEIDLDNGIRVRLGRRDVDARFERFLAAALRLVVQRVTELQYVDMRYSNGFAIGWRDGKRVATRDMEDDDL